MTARTDDFALEALSDKIRAADLHGRLTLAREALPGPLVFTSSFGLEDQALTHAIMSSGHDIEIVTLDTGRLFQETYDVWVETERRYGRRIAAYAPDATDVEAYVRSEGVNGFRHSIASRHSCCGLRKVKPLKRALAGASGWITGLRAEQSAFRHATPFVSNDESHGLLKINPLADWTRADVERFIAEHSIPYNTLDDRGFRSIGCAPCTRAIRPGESERAGRWWWENEDKKECGLHVNADGKLARSPAASGAST